MRGWPRDFLDLQSGIRLAEEAAMEYADRDGEPYTIYIAHWVEERSRGATVWVLPTATPPPLVRSGVYAVDVHQTIHPRGAR